MYTRTYTHTHTQIFGGAKSTLAANINDEVQREVEDHYAPADEEDQADDEESSEGTTIVVVGAAAAAAAAMCPATATKISAQDKHEAAKGQHDQNPQPYTGQHDQNPQPKPQPSALPLGDGDNGEENHLQMASETAGEAVCTATMPVDKLVDLSVNQDVSQTFAKRKSVSQSEDFVADFNQEFEFPILRPDGSRVMDAEKGQSSSSAFNCSSHSSVAFNKGVSTSSLALSENSDDSSNRAGYKLFTADGCVIRFM
jgi:hypothetical protein